MKRKIELCLIVFAVLFLNFSVFAEENNSDSQDTLMAGAGILYRTSVYKGHDNTVLPIPFIYYTKGPFSIKGRSLTYGIYEKDSLSVGLLGVWDFRGYDDDDSHDLAGMHDRDMTIEAGIAARYKDGWGYTTATVVTDMLGKHHGQEFTLSYSKKFNRDKLTLIPSVGVSYLSGDMTNYYYGVRSSEATAVRPMYKPDAAWNPYGALNAAYELNERWSFMGSIRLDLLDKEIQHSPIVDKDRQIQITAGLMYRF
jgi:outer membrane protein